MWKEAFENPAAWKVVAADGVELHASAAEGVKGWCVRLDYDFARGSGYGILRLEQATPLNVPENYRIRFQVRGEGPRNTLEFKLVEKEDAPGTGESVWWVNQREYEFPKEWKEVTLPKRRFGFAWGPSGGAALKRIDAVEIVVTSFNGGKGTVWVDELEMEGLPAVKPYTGTPTVEVSSRGDGGTGPLAINPEGYLGWKSADWAHDATPTATIDFGEAREFGGLVLEWGEPAGPCTDYEVSGALEGGWTSLARMVSGNGGRDYLVTPDAVARRLRVHCTRRDPVIFPLWGEAAVVKGPCTLRSVRVMPPGFADSPNELIKAAAAESPRGWYPRSWLGEGMYWTVVGADGDREEALVSEDGAIELGKQGPSLEPFVAVGQAESRRLITWNETVNTQSLEGGYLPIPTVRRELAAGGGDAGLRLETTCFVDDSPPLVRGEGVLFVRYTLTNTGATEQRPTLFVAGRPMQVNPVYQFLNAPPGAAVVKSATIADPWMRLDKHIVCSLTKPDALSDGLGSGFEQGEIVEYLGSGVCPEDLGENPNRLASCALSFESPSLAPGASSGVYLYAPLHPEKATERLIAWPPTQGEAQELFDSRLATAKREWAEKLNRVTIDLPPAGKRWAGCVRSNLAYILINRDGPGVQPGSRSYERTWIRDGALTSAALLAFGHEAEVREFLDWFAPFQYDNGKVPCCVDKRGPDPVPEHDSHGEYIYAVMNYYRYTGDAAFLRRHWDRVVKAVAYIEFLRLQRMTDEYSDGPDEKRVLYGLVPESISHEGYSAKPMHSYWDDLWTLKGLSDAAEMGEVLGEQGQAARFGALRDSFRDTLRASISLAMTLKNITYIPGCAELGDFDATSTTIGLWPCGESGADGALPEAGVRETFEKYWRFFQSRRDATGDQADWKGYTPYEWRVVGSMIRLGGAWRERAAEAAGFFFNDARPAGWNQWAEVVWRDPRRAEFIGDMPHTWVGSDFINSFRSMIACENDRERSMVIGAGLPLSWVLSKEGVRVEGLRTHWGRLSLVTRSERGSVRFQIGGALRLPDGGLWLSPPGAGLIKALRVDGAPAELSGGLIRLPRTPVEVEVEYGG